MHLTEQARNVGVESDVVHAHRQVDGGIHEKAEIGELSVVELDHDIGVACRLSRTLHVLP